MSGSKSRFDWYASTFESLNLYAVAESLVSALGGSVTEGRGRNGYRKQLTVERDEKVLARVLGESVRVGEVHVVTTSEACDEVVPLLRHWWPEHRVSRCDVAVDVLADFDALDVRSVAFAEKKGLSHRLFTDNLGGATRYLGSPSSEVMVRVYKKSEELRKRHPESASEIPDGIVRAECVVRPNTRMKGIVAKMESDEIWGLAEWSRGFAAGFFELEAERVPTHFREASDWSKALHWMRQQYGPALRRRAQVVGFEQAREELLAALVGE